MGKVPIRWQMGFGARESVQSLDVPRVDSLIDVVSLRIADQIFTVRVLHMNVSGTLKGTFAWLRRHTDDCSGEGMRLLR